MGRGWDGYPSQQTPQNHWLFRSLFIYGTLGTLLSEDNGVLNPILCTYNRTPCRRRYGKEASHPHRQRKASMNWYTQSDGSELRPCVKCGQLTSILMRIEDRRGDITTHPVCKWHETAATAEAIAGEEDRDEPQS